MHVCTVVAGNTASIASGEPGQPVDAADEDVGDAAVSEFGEDLHPELRALGRYLCSAPASVATPELAGARSWENAIARSS
jgi:hypothetical protein